MNLDMYLNAGLLILWVCVSTALAIRSKAQRRPKLVLTAILAALLGAWIFIDSLSGRGIDSSVIYHLRVGVGGAGLKELAAPIAALACALLLCVALPFFPRVERPATWRFASSLFALLFVCTLVFNPLTRDVRKLLSNESSADAVDNYVRVDSALSNRKNLVVLYAESFERAYLDEARFPGLTPELNKLRHKATEFTNVESRDGGTWTIAGIVSSLCGVPLSLSGDANGYGSIGEFLPAARCLTDNLKDHNYDLEFIGGASLDFAGKGSFLASHGFSTIRGKEHFTAMNLGTHRFSYWGVHDDVLLDTIWQRYTQLASKPQPFALVGLTLDTHPPSGHLPYDCRQVDYRGLGEKRDMLNAIQCSDKLIGKFIKRIMSSRYWDDTILVIASDHTAMPNDVADLLRTADRNNLLLMFEKGKSPRLITQHATTLDTGATILDALGGGTELGFGRSQLPMLSSSITSSRTTGPDRVDRFPSFMAFSKSLWNLGTLQDRLQLSKDVVRLGEQSLRAPLSIAANQKGEVVGIGTVGIRSANLSAGDSQQRDLIYIDRCRAFGQTDGADDWCMWGKVEGQTKLVTQAALQRGGNIRDLLSNDGIETQRGQLRNDFIIKRHFSDTDTVVGAATDGKIYSHAREGVLTFGPHEDVCAGSYHLSIEGHATNVAGSWADIVADSGASRLGQVDLIESKTAADGHIATGSFVFANDIKMGEIRVGVTNDAVVRVDSYSLIPQFQPAKLNQKINFDTSSNGDSYLSCGWSAGDSSGRKLAGDAGSLRVGIPVQGNRSSIALKLGLRTNVSQSLQININDKPATEIALKPGEFEYQFALPDSKDADQLKEAVITLIPSNQGCGDESCKVVLSFMEVIG